MSVISAAYPAKNDGFLQSAASEEDMPPELINIRGMATKGLLALMWLVAPVVGAGAFFAGNDWVITAIGSVAAAVLATMIGLRDPSGAMTRYTIAAGLVGQWMMLIYAANGTPDGFVLDAHMFYFVINGVLATYFCWRTLIVANVLAAVHHTVLAFLFPALIWPTSGFSFLHYGIHVAYVLLQTGPLLMVAFFAVNKIFRPANAARIEAEKATQRAEAMAIEQREAETRHAAERRQAMIAIAEKFEKDIASVVGAVTESVNGMSKTATSLSETAKHSASESANMTSASEETSSNVQTVAAATEELSASIQEIASQIAGSTDVASQAVGKVELSGRQIIALSEAAERVGDVVNLISSLADQTNLLALNATIEASRAGEAGKGFAVVATEVKALAAQTAKATEEISSYISSIQDATSQTVGSVQDIAQTIEQMNSISSAIAAAIEEQSAATRDISANIQKAAEGTHNVSAGSASVANASQKTQSEASAMVGASSDLAQKADDMRVHLARLIEGIKAA